MIALLACSRDRSPPRTLASYLESVAAMDPVQREREVASWQLDAATWRRIVVEPYRELHAEYAAAYDVAVPAIAARLRGPVATRAHYAGDPQLTAGEAWTRWALPVAFASEVASAGGTPIDAVFVRDGERWVAIAGLDRVIRGRVAALDPDCAAVLDTPARRCRELAWQVTDAALRETSRRFARACALAVNHCGKRSP